MDVRLDVRRVLDGDGVDEGEVTGVRERLLGHPPGLNEGAQRPQRVGLADDDVDVVHHPGAGVPVMPGEEGGALQRGGFNALGVRSRTTSRRLRRATSFLAHVNR